MRVSHAQCMRVEVSDNVEYIFFVPRGFVVHTRATRAHVKLAVNHMWHITRISSSQAPVYHQIHMAHQTCTTRIS